MNFDNKDLVREIETIEPSAFNLLALRVFRYQAYHNPLYKYYLSLLKVEPQMIDSIESIPFLPISFFKTHQVKSAMVDQDVTTNSITFSSSGTMGQTTSQHHVKDLRFYLRNTQRGFEYFYGKVEDYCILGLLPSYLERQGSSLIAMVDYFVQCSRYTQSGFFLYNHDELAERLLQNTASHIPTILIGVSFALLDFAEQYPINLKDVIIMETGGMKGRRKELTRTELHTKLQKAFNVSTIHSEYGMTEMLSQAYSKGAGLFYPTPTLKVLAREITDPFTIQKCGRIGALNIIDLANLDSCAFIATDDLGSVYQDGSFEILGRLDNSDIRGCNLLII